MQEPTRGARSRRSRWFPLVWVIPSVLVLLVVIVLAARALVATPALRSFLADYPGQSALPAGAPVGFPAWLEWQHFFNGFFLLFILRSGWIIRGKKRPTAFWVRRNEGRFVTRTPPVRIGIQVWLHLATDALWVLNGIAFYVLLFATGQWVRIVPTRWDVIPNAISAGLQYASLDWPTASGWTNYNALQVITYFITVFVAAPLAVITGIRLIPGLALRFAPLDPVFSARVARAIHYPVMIWFAGFIVVHVTLVLATGAVHNLNHMYAGRDDGSLLGFAIFAASVVVMVVAWFALRPAVVTAIAGRTGSVRTMPRG